MTTEDPGKQVRLWSWIKSPELKKYLLIVVVASCALALICGAGIILLALWLPPEDCDEGIFQGSGVENTRGDVASQYVKACTGLGTDAYYSIVLKMRTSQDLITLARYERLVYPYPRLHWANDNTLVMEFRKDHSVWSRLTRVGDIRIIYDYSSAEPAR